VEEMSKVAREKDVREPELRDSAMRRDVRSIHKLRMDIGVSNPYALTELRMGKAQNWIEMRPRQKMSLVQKIMKKPFKELFDPRLESPLYSRKIRRKTRLNVGAGNPYALAARRMREYLDWTRVKPEQKLEILEEVLRKPFEKLFDPRLHSPIYPRRLRESEIATTRKTRAAADPCCPVNVPSWGTIGTYFNTNTLATERYTDPVQGCAGDCYLIAALSSLAWINIKLVKPTKLLDGTIKFPFATAPKTFSVKQEIPLDTNGNPIFSHAPTPIESWPGIHEKAYAAWRTASPPQTPVPPDYPDICSIEVGNALVALMDLTRNNYSPYSIFPTNCGNPSNLLDQLKALCNDWNPANTNKQTCRTILPTVAWTYFDSTHVPGNSSGAIQYYTDDMIVANHSYSVLGLYKDTTNQYVVLRNPYGPCSGISAWNLLIQGDWVIKDAIYDCGLPQAGFFEKDRTIPFNVNTGVFALEIGQFCTLFETVGYIT
jgi:hypothetical protein